LSRYRRSRLRNLAGNLLLTLISCLTFLVVAELVAWQFNPPPRQGLPVDMFQSGPNGVWIMTPDFRGVMDNRVDFTNVPATADASGARVVPAAPAEAPHRLLVIGDSQTFGHGLSDEDSWPNRLQESLNRRDQGVKVANLAIPAINIDQYLARVRVLAPSLRPTDTILIGMSWNDLITPPSDQESNRIVAGHLVSAGSGDSDAAIKARVRLYDFTGIRVPRFQSLKTVLDTLSQESALVSTLYPRAKAIYYRLRSHSPVGDLVKAGVPEANFLMMRQIAGLIAPTGARLVVVLLPERIFFEDGPFAVYSVSGRDFPTQDYQAALAQPLCRDAGITCVNAFPLLHDHHSDGLVFPVDGHFNAKGAALIGEWLAGALY
jgi:lysophospholipase L1-like esterase